MKPIFLTILVLVAGVGYADPISPGALVWVGTPSVDSWYCISCTDTDGSPTANLTGTGLSIEGGGYDDFSVSTGYTVSTDFTVTVAGDFLLSSSVSYSALGTDCSDVRCAPPGYVFTGEFSGNVDISGPDGSSQPFAASGSAPPCDPVLGTCFLSLSDTEQAAVDLAVGDYVLGVNYSDTNNSLGDSQTSSKTDISLIPAPVPTPEPRELGLLLAGMAILFLAKVRPRLRHRP